MEPNNITNLNYPVVDNVTKIIDRKGLKRKKVASLSGFTEQSFSDVVNVRRILKVNEVIKIANALDVSVDELFKTD